MNPFTNNVPPHQRHPAPHATAKGAMLPAPHARPPPVRAQKVGPPTALATSAELAQRQQTLAQASAQLKAELFGIDDVIDRVIDAVRAW